MVTGNPPDGETGEKGGGGMLLDFLKKTGTFKWARAFMHNLGGRKFLLGGGALVLLREIFAGGEVSWAKAVAGLAIALTVIGISWTIASEDKAKKESDK